MYRIGEFSRMSRTTVKTLRYYEEAGLLRPEVTDPYTGYRLYTTNQLFEVHKIQSLRQIGLSIAEIRQVLVQHGSMHEILECRKARIAAEIACKQDQLSRIEFILTGQEEKKIMEYQAIIKELPACNVYSTKKVIPSYDAYFEVIPAIGEKVTQKYPNLKCSIPAYCFVKYLDGEYKEKDISIEFCEAIETLEPDFEDITFRKMEAVTAVCILHKGPYSTLSRAYSFLSRWIEDNGYTIADCPRESYIDGIWNKESDADWLTELQIPIKKK